MSLPLRLGPELHERKAAIRGAVIVGGAHGSLAVARSLGRRGIPVWFVSSGHPIAKFSRYTERSFDWAGPNSDGALRFLLDLAIDHRLEGWVLVAGGDAELRLMARHRAELSKLYAVTAPDWETARWAYDKRLTYQHAATLGIDCPQTYRPRNRQDLGDITCRFPVILKPAVRESQNAFTRAKAWRADDRAALLARYAEAAALVGPDGIVLQELVPGDGTTQYSYAAVWDHGAPVASLVARRSRQFPVDFGRTSTFVEAAEQHEVEEAASRFLRSIAFSGPVEVEFKRDPRDHRFKLLDINARVWTWIALGAAAGVDLPYVQWRLATGQAVARTRGHAGVAWMHGSRDAVAACHEMLIGRLTPSAYLQSLRQQLVFAAFAVDDVVPGLVDVPLVLARLLGRRMPALAHASGHIQRSRVHPSP